MKAEQIRAVLRFEEKLNTGSIVICKWNTDSNKYRAKALVSKIERFYILCKILDSTKDHEVGYSVRVPRFLNSQSLWNQFSRVEPLTGYTN